MAGQWLTADEQRAWRAYLRAGTLLRARLNRQLQADSGLSLPEYEVLVQLSEAPGGRLARSSSEPPCTGSRAGSPIRCPGGFATHGTSWFGHQGPAG